MAQRATPQHQAQDIGFWEVLAFGCELGMLAGFAVTGWVWGASGVWRFVGAVLTPGPAAVVWALWLAPTAGRRLSGVASLVVKAAVFGLSGAGLAWAGHRWWGFLLVVVSLTDLAVLHWRETRPPRGVTQEP